MNTDVGKPRDNDALRFLACVALGHCCCIRTPQCLMNLESRYDGVWHAGS